MIDISKRYLEAEEAGRNHLPYEDFYKCMSQTFNFSTISSIIDVGCSDGHLLSCLLLKHPHLRVDGIEYFDYHLKYASKNVVDRINILDVRNPLSNEWYHNQYDIVVCTEVGEHIDPDCCDIFIKNLRRLTGKYLIMTWSSHGGEREPENDPHHQHLNPLSFQEYKKLLESYDFQLDDEKTKIMHAQAENCNNFFSWWKESLIVWSL